MASGHHLEQTAPRVPQTMDFRFPEAGTGVRTRAGGRGYRLGISLVVVVEFWEALEVLLKLFDGGVFVLDVSDRVLEERFGRRSDVLHGLPEQWEVVVGVVRQDVER